ncbi:HNH endonuclease family protein [Nitrosomonas communis]|uniref:HNH endonuclease family protein n=1 Tax=Nitrosomonas communis TaxID=44574 RepID=UPI003D2B4ED3
MRNVFLFLLLIATLVMLHGCATDKQIGRHPPQVDTPLTSKPYNRKDWPHWIDADGDCQNTRQELLIATSTAPVKFKDSRRCTVIAGKWFGVYTGKIFTQASDVDIDHIVPLAHAHRHGADSWTKKRRRAFANDFDNLIVVSDKTNHAKSDKAPHEWLPPRKAYWCEYGKRWKHIKHKYQLISTQQEQAALNSLAKTCR